MAKKPNPEFANFGGSVKAFVAFRASSSDYLWNGLSA